MSKGFDTNGLFVDTGFLRDHISKLREEKKLALQLYDSMTAMQHCSDPAVSYQYTPILRDIEQLIEYFERMAKLLAHVNDEAVQLSHELGELMEEDTNSSHHTVSATYML